MEPTDIQKYKIDDLHGSMCVDSERLGEYARELILLRDFRTAIINACEKFAQYHHDTCAFGRIPGYPCSCGKDEVDAAIAKAY